MLTARSCFAPLLLLVLAAAPLAAQSQATTAVVRGTVTGADGDAIQGASVTLRNVNTNFTRRVSAASS